MRFSTLDQWLAWQETLHPRAIDMGLERIRPVADALGLLNPAMPVITVAGTNGKGSCVAYAEAILLAAGYRTGAYVSPHLLRYNERIRLSGAEVDDASLLRAFEAVDAARGATTLSYFEFGTLAAFWLFREAGVEVQILEVGLGGRLDAVNLVDADVAVISSVGIDHTDWLGPDVESIGREKAGIFRSGRPAVLASADMPASVTEVARHLGVPLRAAGTDYTWDVAGNGAWCWQRGERQLRELPRLPIAGEVQYANAAAVLTALDALNHRLPVSPDAIRTGLAGTRLAGRMQRLPGAVEWLLDVAHNADSARALARHLASEPVTGRRFGVVALLRRKDRQAVLAPLQGVMDGWYLLQLADQAAWPPQALEEILGRDAVLGHGGAAELLARIGRDTRPGDQVVVFGSFRTVEDILRHRPAISAA
ncbi:MAG: bifunctional tetrahydrofolate synthase/dihydrofolate synthase [Aquisalimonadaceae bacterium]